MTNTSSRTEALRREILAEVAAHWNDAGLQYSVVHGAEHYPEQMGRDMDVMADPSSEAAVIAATLSVFREQEWTATAHRMAVGVTRIVGHRTEGDVLHAAEIDVAAAGLRWGPVVFLDRPSPEAACARRGPFVVDLWGSFVKRILIQALSRNVQRLEGRPAELDLSDREARIAETRLAEFVAPALAADFVAAVRAKDLDRMRACAGPLRSALLRNSLRGPALAATVRGAIGWAWDRLALSVFMRKAAPVVALVGPDHIDKSAIIDAMRASMRDELIFPEMVVRRAPRAAGEANGHRANGAVRFVRHALRAATTLLSDRQRSARLYLVVYDGWPLDTGGRTRVRPSWWVRGLARLLPRPDLVISLRAAGDGSTTGPEPTSGSRTAPAPAGSARAEQRAVDLHLTVDAPPAEMARRVLRAVVETFTKMHQERDIE